MSVRPCPPPQTQHERSERIDVYSPDQTTTSQKKKKASLPTKASNSNGILSIRSKEQSEKCPREPEQPFQNDRPVKNIHVGRVRHTKKMAMITPGCRCNRSGCMYRQCSVVMWPFDTCLKTRSSFKESFLSGHQSKTLLDCLFWRTFDLCVKCDEWRLAIFSDLACLGRLVPRPQCLRSYL